MTSLERQLLAALVKLDIWAKSTSAAKGFTPENSPSMDEARKAARLAIARARQPSYTWSHETPLFD